ncbi:hypothetical protein ACH5RR_019539 [Cinchona calisaya]|uniref:KIB1-4 beta-propeller domain-containing protein n=1 Tax=Cinchona calisaya TaxID=153742 RepID=A0ABD2ZPM2_9GENT
MKAPPPLGTCDTDQKYLVESSSADLLLISRFRKGTLFVEEINGPDVSYYTVGFSVMKLDKCSSSACEDHHDLEDQGSTSTCTTISTKYRYKLTEVNNLGEMALFLGRNPSLSLWRARSRGT